MAADGVLPSFSPRSPHVLPTFRPPSLQVRDQRAYLWHDEQQGMMVRVVDPKGGLPAPTVPGKRPDEQLQFVMALNMDDWEHMCRVVKPDDTKVGATGGGGAGGGEGRGNG